MRPKTSSLISGNRLGEKYFFPLTHSHSLAMCIRIYISNFKKQTGKKKTKTRIQKKEIKLKKENISEKSIKKIAAASLAFPETKVFFWPELHFSNFCALNVCVITERLEINRLCKHMKNVRSSQAFILVMN